MKENRRGLIFGAFDPLHFGHIRLIKRAFEVCDEVWACTESDEIIRQEKGREPFTSETERVEDLSAIKYLSGVKMRSVAKDRGFIADLVKPDVLILSDEYKRKDWEGKKLGIRMIFFPHTKGISSTFLREELCKPKKNT